MGSGFRFRVGVWCWSATSAVFGCCHANRLNGTFRFRSFDPLAGVHVPVTLRQSFRILRVFSPPQLGEIVL